MQNFIEQEFLRSCAIACASLRKVADRETGLHRGSTYETVRFRCAILDTVGPVGACSSSSRLSKKTTDHEV